MPDFGRWTSNGGDPSLNDVNRVDRFFDALGSNETAYSTDHAEAELAFLFADWRDEVRNAPVTAPVTTRDAVDALNAGLGTRKRSRASLAIVGSAAAAVLCIGGVGAAVYSAGPGDAFYGLRTALFGEQAATRDDSIVLTAQAEMLQVQQLIDDGQWEQAQDKLVALSSTVQSVETPEQKQQLVQQFNQLTVKVVEQDPAATLPPDAPLPTFTDSPLTLLPLPTFQIGDTTTTSPSTSTDTSATNPSETTSTTTSTDTTAPSESSDAVSTTPSSTPGPEILLTPPPSSPPSESPANPSTSAPPPSTAPSSPTTTTTTRIDVTSVTSVPSVPPSVPAASSPSPRPEPPSSQAEPPPSQVVTPTRQPEPAPPAEAPTDAPSSQTKAPKPRVEEPAPVTTTMESSN